MSDIEWPTSSLVNLKQRQWKSMICMNIYIYETLKNFIMTFIYSTKKIKYSYICKNMHYEKKSLQVIILKFRLECFNSWVPLILNASHVRQKFKVIPVTMSIRHPLIIRRCCSWWEGTSLRNKWRSGSRHCISSLSDPANNIS